jgi:hypothetical protein
MVDPRTHRSRKSAIFRASYAKTLDLLENELRCLAAVDITIEAGFALDQIRNDGWPRSSQRPAHPAARLSFRSRGNSIAFPCDTYASIDDNLRAIALTLQALRAIDRYGVSQGAEQYKGWLALPAPAPADEMSRDQAIAFLSLHSGLSGLEIGRDEESVRKAYRKAALDLHPDAGRDGTDAGFARLQLAMQILNAEARRG